MCLDFTHSEHQHAPLSSFSSPTGPVMHRGPDSAAHIHSTPDEEAGKTRDEAGEGGGVGGGGVRRAGCDAVERS